jgi:hypothetical protein
MGANGVHAAQGIRSQRLARANVHIQSSHKYTLDQRSAYDVLILAISHKDRRLSRSCLAYLPNSLSLAGKECNYISIT